MVKFGGEIGTLYQMLKNAFKKHPLQNRTNVQIKGGGGQRPFEQCSKKLHFFERMASLREGVKKKERYLTVRLTISIYPTPPYGQLFLVCFLSWIIILCVLQQILHKEKVIFIQLLEFPILHYCSLLFCNKMVG